ncbi:hypothetical protein GGR55DRAFT_682080 [Xylaria sp. FL0064]|nr:hypothetical protein GGR55DRAFT_682080 [Xylaria sp. FL0064]
MTQRTQDSLIFGAAARNVHSSSPRFQWDSRHEYAFHQHIATHIEVETMYHNMGLLLGWLNLDGYEAVVNDRGENVHKIIVKKVKEKILTLRRKAGLSKPRGTHADTHAEQELLSRDASEEQDEQPLPENIDPRLLIKQPPAQLRPAQL